MFWRLLTVLSACATLAAQGQSAASADSDHDGLSDVFEAALLETFRPTLMVSAADCSTLPARFKPGLSVPAVQREDGTLYGQAFPRLQVSGQPRQIELHYYHLWRQDCGRMGHPLDAEHVAVLLQADSGPGNKDASQWAATYWYAAAHEDTVCDASQVARASTLGATTHGTTVWVSNGKHASFLNEELCRHGCGGDTCVQSRPLPASAVTNLGEAAYPMNGALWVAAREWPLVDKVTRSDFPAIRLARLDRLSKRDVAWANPGKRPAQAAILSGNTAVNGTLRGSQATGSALAVSNESTDKALTLASDSTTGALSKAGKATGLALSRALSNIKHGLRH